MKENEIDEVIREFLIESYENLDQIDQDIVILEKDPTKREVFDKIFRTLHTIKGSCSFLGYSKLESVAHNGENLLDALRNGEMELNSEIISILLTVIDEVRKILRNIEENREEGNEDYAELVVKLKRLQGEEAVAKKSTEEKKLDKKSIYFRVGGRESVIAVVDGLYERVLNDPELKRFFKSTNMNVLKNMQVQFFSQALGGPEKYKGRDLRAAHGHLGIERRHFERALIHLVATLQSLNVPQSIVDEIRTAIQKLAPQIVSSDSRKGGFEGMEDSGRKETLFDRIGGAQAVAAAVERFYERVLDDPDLSGFFSHVDLTRLKAHQVGFFTQALGGPSKYQGRDMKTAHTGLSIERWHFDRVVEHLVVTLQELNVPQSLIEEIGEALSPLADQIIASPKAGIPSPGKGKKESGSGTENLSGPAVEEHHSGVSETTIRVEVDLLDKLMTLVGEMVLARNQILQFADTSEDSGFLATVQRLNLITSELQETAMKTRMQPIGNVWSRFPRMVRDISLTLGKKVRLEMEGRDTELDKSIIEAIRDPLTHLVRNAVDHGIEKPEKRSKKEKPPEGSIFLRAFHEGGNVNIEITDDGGGINPERVKQKAVQRGLITQQQAGEMTDQQALNLIFLPGFSLAENVTNLSGRGVGMDVVRSNLEKVSGTVEVNSRVGQGTTFKIRIPLTLAIIPALVVNCNGDYYSIPQVSLLELVRIETGEGERGVEMVHGAPVYRLRGNLLPLVFLSSVLEGRGSFSEETVKSKEGIVNIVVLQADDRTFGLVVEGINDTEEIVVKPLGRRLKGISCFAGAAIRGDGRVALILDVPGLARHAKVVSEERGKTTVVTPKAGQEDTEDLTTLLLFAVGSGRMALPLSIVARLEEFPLSALEYAGNQEVVQYRGEIMPLIRISEILMERRQTPRVEDKVRDLEGENILQVVVYNRSGRSVGIVVDRILDILQDQVKIQQQSSRKGVRGSVVIQERVTELVDVEEIIEMAIPEFLRQEMAIKGED